MRLGQVREEVTNGSMAEMLERWSHYVAVETLNGVVERTDAGAKPKACRRRESKFSVEDNGRWCEGLVVHGDLVAGLVCCMRI